MDVFAEFPVTMRLKPGFDGECAVRLQVVKQGVCLCVREDKKLL